MQDTFPVKKELKTEEAKVEKVNKILRNINFRKAAEADKIPPKIVNTSTNIINPHLTNKINNDLKRNAFSNSAKVGSICPIFKGKGERTEIKNYRPVSILNCFSKVYERFIQKILRHQRLNFYQILFQLTEKGIVQIMYS